MRDVYGSLAWLAKWFAALIIGQWLAVPGPVHALIVLMLLDLGAILFVGLILSRRLDGRAFWTAACIKGLTLLVVAALKVASDALHITTDLGAVWSVGFVANETISILRHAALGGAPIPAKLLYRLQQIQKLPEGRLSGEKKGKSKL